MRMFALAACFSTALAAGAAAAESKCDDASSTHDMRQCLQREYEAADRRLNAVYAKAMKALKDTYTPDLIENAGGQDPVADLRDAQRKWIAFRDANCRSLGTQMLGGSFQSVLEIGCLGRMTKERATELQTFLPE